MATRATIGYLNPDNTITTTYNHYDGYPENLGVALKNHYATNEKAKEIANMGYVSYVNPENGDIEANNKSNPVTVGDSDLVSSIQYFKDQASEGDYAYLWVPQNEEWMYAPTAMKMEDFVDVFVMGIDFMDDEDDMANYDTIDNMEEGYKAKWKKFLNEESNPEFEQALKKYSAIKGDQGEGREELLNAFQKLDDKQKMKYLMKLGQVQYAKTTSMNEESFFKDDPTTIRWEKIRDNAYRMLKSEDGNQVNDYVDALERQIKFKPSDADKFIEYDRTDWKADFDDYVSDKMDF